MEAYIEFARRLSDVSAQIIKQYFRSDVNVDAKADGSPVTIADKRAEEVMREMIMAEFPGHGIIGEEFEDYQPDAANVWLLDPIDGTKNFVAGSFLFGTLITLTQGGQPVLGVINHPITDHFLLGANGETRLNGKQVRVRPCRRVEDALLLSSSHWGMGNHQDMVAYETLTRRVRSYRTWGDCHGYFLVATGYGDIMLDSILNPWDITPLIPIIEGAGGRITDWHGNSALNSRSAVATAGDIHDAVIQILNPGK